MNYPSNAEQMSASLQRSEVDCRVDPSVRREPVEELSRIGYALLFTSADGQIARSRSLYSFTYADALFPALLSLFQDRHSS